jgi:DNA polymerase phi
MNFLYTHEFNHTIKNNNSKVVIKEYLIDGPKGLYFILKKKDDKNFHIIKVKEIENNKFNILDKKEPSKNVDDKKESIKKTDDKDKYKIIDEDALKKLIDKNSDLKFVKNYMDNERAKYKTGNTNIIIDKEKKTSKKFTGKNKIKKLSKKIIGGSRKKLSKKNTNNMSMKKSSNKKSSNKKSSNKKSSNKKSSNKKSSRKKSSKKNIY